MIIICLVKKNLKILRSLKITKNSTVVWTFLPPVCLLQLNDLDQFYKLVTFSVSLHMMQSQRSDILTKNMRFELRGRLGENDVCETCSSVSLWLNCFTCIVGTSCSVLMRFMRGAIVMYVLSCCVAVFSWMLIITPIRALRLFQRHPG